MSTNRFITERNAAIERAIGGDVCEKDIAKGWRWNDEPYDIPNYCGDIEAIREVIIDALPREIYEAVTLVKNNLSVAEQNNPEILVKLVLVALGLWSSEWDSAVVGDNGEVPKA